MKSTVWVLVIALILPISAGAAIQDIQVSNQTSAAATISWITDSDTTGEVHYSENPDLSNPLTAHDEREQSFVGRTHYVTIGNLKKETSYYFEVVSGGEVNNNSGNYYTFKTMKEKLYIPCTIYGFVKQQDGTGAENAIIYLWVTHDGVDSYLLSKLVPSNGSFTSDIKGARSAETDDLFSSIDPGDLIHLRAVYGVNCTTSGEIEFDSCLQNLGSITLQCSQSECDGNFDCDGDVDGMDALQFKADYGRMDCTNEDPCNGDFDCNGVVDGMDALQFKINYGRMDCGPCSGETYENCIYE